MSLATTSTGEPEIEVLLSGVTFGPFTEAKVRERLAENLLALTDPARFTESDAWQPLEKVLEQIPPASVRQSEPEVTSEPQTAEKDNEPVEFSTPEAALPLPSGEPASPEVPAVILPVSKQAPGSRVTLILPPEGRRGSAPSAPVEARASAGTGPLPGARKAADTLRGRFNTTGTPSRSSAPRPGTKALGGIRSQILARTSALPAPAAPSSQPSGLTRPVGPSITAPLSARRIPGTGWVAPPIKPSAVKPEAAPAPAAVDEPLAPPISLLKVPPAATDSTSGPDVAAADKIERFSPPAKFSDTAKKPDVVTNREAVFTVPREPEAAATAPPPPVSAPPTPQREAPVGKGIGLPPKGGGIGLAPKSTSTLRGPSPPVRAPGPFPVTRPKLDHEEAAALPPPPASASELPSPPPRKAKTGFVSPAGPTANSVSPANRAVSVSSLATAALPPPPPAKPAEKRPSSSIDNILTVRLPARRTQVIKTLPGAPLKSGELKISESRVAPPSSSQEKSIPPVAAGSIPERASEATPARPGAGARSVMASALAATTVLSTVEKKEPVPAAASEGDPMETAVNVPRPPSNPLSARATRPASDIKEPGRPPSTTPLVETRRAALRQARERRKRQFMIFAAIALALLLLLSFGIYRFTANASHDAARPATPAPSQSAPAVPAPKPSASSTTIGASEDFTAPKADLAPPAETLRLGDQQQSEASQDPPSPPPDAPTPLTTLAVDATPQLDSVPQADMNVTPPNAGAPNAKAPEDPQVLALLAKGQAAQAKGDHDAALAAFTQAIATDAKYAPAYNLRSIAYQSKGDLVNAIADSNQQLTLDPNNANGFCQRGFLKQSQRDIDGAMADYTRALELDPRSYIAFYNRGMLQEQKGQPDLAIVDYNGALELNPRLPGAYYNRGNAKMDKGDFDGAIADYTNALQIDPKIALAACNRALAEQNLGNLTGALADYGRALALNPKLALAYYNRGLVEEQVGQLDRCIEDSTKALVLAPENVQAYYNRGVALQAQGNLDAAANDLRKFEEVAPKNAYTDYARLYLWIIDSQQDRKASADQTLAAKLESSWNAEPAQLPSKIAAFLLGRVPETELMAVAGSDDSLKNQAQHCEVWYFDGVKKLLSGDKAAAAACFRQCLSTGQKNYCEYILASAALHGITS